MRRAHRPSHPGPSVAAPDDLRRGGAWIRTRTMMSLRFRSLAPGLVALLLLAGPAHAQSPSALLTGAVTDAATGAPLPGATVAAPALGRGIATDAGGRFRLSGLPAEAVEVVVSFVGYEPVTRTVDLSYGAATLKVALAAEALELDEVEVAADAARARLTRDVRPVAALGTAEIEAMRGQTLGEMLARLNGVTVLTTGPSISKPVVRG